MANLFVDLLNLLKELFSVFTQDFAHLEFVIRKTLFARHTSGDVRAAIMTAKHSRSLLPEAGYNGVHRRNTEGR